MDKCTYNSEIVWSTDSSSYSPFTVEINKLIIELSKIVSLTQHQEFISTVSFDCIRGIKARDLCKDFAEKNKDWKVT